MSNRREFLKAAGGASVSSVPLLAALAKLAPVSAQPAAGLSAVNLTDRLLQLRGAGGNVLVLTGPEGLALVDSGAPEHARALGAWLERELRAPVLAVFNTHWHLESTGGNELFRAAGARIYAHENTRLWMSTEFYVKWQDVNYPPRAEGALPTDTFYSHQPQPLVLELGGRRIEHGHLPEAHTDGDVYVSFPDENVIAAGGVAWKGTYPIIDFTTGGWIGGMAAATRQLIDMADQETLIVPETGPALKRSDLAVQHEMLVTVQERVADAMRKGKSVPEMVAEGVTADFDPAWGNGAQAFVANVYGGMWWGGRLSGAL